MSAGTQQRRMLDAVCSRRVGFYWRTGFLPTAGTLFGCDAFGAMFLVPPLLERFVDVTYSWVVDSYHVDFFILVIYVY